MLIHDGIVKQKYTCKMVISIKKTVDISTFLVTIAAIIRKECLLRYFHVLSL